MNRFLRDSLIGMDATAWGSTAGHGTSAVVAAVADVCMGRCDVDKDTSPVLGAAADETARRAEARR